MKRVLFAVLSLAVTSVLSHVAWADSPDARGASCFMAFAEYQSDSDTPRVEWTKPLNYDPKKSAFSLDMKTTPMATLPSFKIDVYPDLLLAMPQFHQLGISVEVYIGQQDNLLHGNYSFSTPLGMPNKCNFQWGWHEGFNNSTGKGARHFVLNCDAPVEFCEDRLVK